mmetsp:Transcript_119574/g.333656  ORF Transcript_119574/g.333656 Transcript_119574/m.333656 type:complete len:207 (-) Transcript_119574:7-627(-)
MRCPSGGSACAPSARRKVFSSLQCMRLAASSGQVLRLNTGIASASIARPSGVAGTVATTASSAATPGSSRSGGRTTAAAPRCCRLVSSTGQLTLHGSAVPGRALRRYFRMERRSGATRGRASSAWRTAQRCGAPWRRARGDMRHTGPCQSSTALQRRAARRFLCRCRRELLFLAQHGFPEPPPVESPRTFFCAPLGANNTPTSCVV